MEKYKIIVDGREIVKNVSPNKKDKFFEKYPNAVLVSDEPGKSQGTSQSQNNQQENTVLKSGDGSLEPKKNIDIKLTPEEAEAEVDNDSRWANFKDNIDHAVMKHGNIKANLAWGTIKRIGSWFEEGQEEDDDKHSVMNQKISEFTGLNPDNIFVDFTADMTRAVQKGWAISQGSEASINIQQAQAKGEMPDEEDIKKLYKNALILEKLGTTDEVRGYAEKYEGYKEKYGGVMAWTMAAAENPTFLIQTSAESLSNMGSHLINSPTTLKRAVGYGTAVGSAAATTVAVGGQLGPQALVPEELVTVPGAFGAGFIGGFFGAISGSMEQSLTFTELLQEELTRDGKEFTPENIKALLLDDEIIKHKDPRFGALDIEGTKSEVFRKRAFRRGLAIGFVDGTIGAITKARVGFLFKSQKNLRKVTTIKGRKVVPTKGVIAAEGTALGVGGGLGSEVAGQTAGGQEYDAGEILTEGFAEKAVALTGVTTVPTLLKKSPKYTVNGEQMGEQNFMDMLSDMSDIEIMEAMSKGQIKIENNSNLESIVNNRINDGYLDSQIDKKVVDPAERKRLVELEKQRKKLEQKQKDNSLFSNQNSIEEKLIEIEKEINQIVGSFTAIDGRTKDVKANVKLQEQGTNAMIDLILQPTSEFINKNLKFVNKGNNKLGYANTVEEAKAMHDNYVDEYNKNLKPGEKPMKKYTLEEMSKVDGFRIGGLYVINKKVAAAKGQINVGGHELLHGIVDGFFEELDVDARKALVKDFRSSLSKKQESWILKQMGARGQNWVDANADSTVEWFNIFSDGIKKENEKAGTGISFDEGVFQKIGLAIEEILRRLSEAGFIGEGNALYRKEFANGRQVYNFLKDYNNSIEKNTELSSRVQKMADVSAVAEEKKGKKKETQLSQSVDVDSDQFQDMTPAEILDSLSEDAKTKEEFYGGRKKADNARENSAYSKTWIALYDGSLDRFFAKNTTEAQKNIMREVLAERLKNWDPAKTPNLSKWFMGGSGVQGNIDYARMVANKKLFIESDKKNKTVRGDRVKETGRTVMEDVAGTQEDTATTAFEEQDVSISQQVKDIASKKQPSKKQTVRDVLRKQGKFVDEVLSFPKKVINSVSEAIKKVKFDFAGKTYLDIKNDVVSQATDANTRKQVKPTGAFYKALEIVSKEVFGVDPKSIIAKAQNLSKNESNGARKKISDIAKEIGPKNLIKNILPKAQTESGQATGIAKTLLKAFYDKVPIRLPNKYAQRKKVGLTDEQILATFGINPDYSLMDHNRKFDGPIKGFIVQSSTLSTNQTLREQAVENKLEELLETNDKATIEEAINAVGSDVQTIGVGKSDTMFSMSLSQVEEIFVNDNFHIEGKGKDKVLVIHNQDKTFRITQENADQDLDAYVEMLKKDVFVLLPKEAFFGPSGGTAFTSTSKIFGLSSLKDENGKTIKDANGKSIQDPLWIKIQERIKALKDDGSIQYGEPIPGVDSSTIWNLRSKYGSMFSTPAKIKANKKEIKEFNRQVAAIHRALWERINTSIKKSKGKSAPGIATYLGIVANDRTHWHKLGAQVVGFSKTINKYKDKNGKVKEARYELEHAMPATNAYLYLLDAALSKDVNFNATYDLIIDNYKLIALDKAMDRKLVNAKTKSGYSLQKRMPDNWSVVDGRWWERYFNPAVAAFDGGIDPSSIETIDGQTLAEEFDIKSDGRPSIMKESRSEVGINNNILKAFEKQAELIKKQNREIQADLESRGYKFIESKTKLSQSPDAKGMSTFDFDETVGVSENFVIAKKGNDIKRIPSNEWPFVGEQLAEEGYKFDFTDFNKVTKGKPGPLFEKMKNQIKKYGPENVFILTARAPQSEKAIHDWLASNGINIPRKNVTGLGNSTGQAKANWMLEKFAEGYNDMYFVDDALPNVKAVKNVLDQLDIKSKVVQAKFSQSLDVDIEFNDMLERKKGMDSKRVVGSEEARKMGQKKGRWKLFVPPSAEDFKGLLYSFLGRGKIGEADMAFFKKTLLDPFAKGIRAWNTYKQSMVDDYAALQKKYPAVVKMLNKKVGKTAFTVDTAIRVYLWDKAGFEIPGISQELKNKLINYVNSNQDLVAFAEVLSAITKTKEGYIKPSKGWGVETISNDLNNIVGKVGRKRFLQEWISNIDIIFSEKNLNKIEAIYGTGFRDALENIIYRMKNGTNRITGSDKNVNRMMNWINGSIGAIMFVNMRSALLQTISTVNFINWSDNNVFKAAAAFANQKQFWADFAMLFNSAQLKQRRSGLQIDVSASELSKAFADGKGTPQSVLAWLLEKGFTPTKIADSFAIAFGGATFIRNRINTYIKQGMSEAKAKEKAMFDFQEIAEETQQSSREDLISQQQAGPLGRLILAFQNVTMQYTRLTKKALSDIVNRRGDMKTNISKLMYYGFVQNLIFGALQSGLMFMLFGWNEEDEDEKKKTRGVLNGALDSFLRGTGIYGAMASTLKNTILKWQEQREKKWGQREDGRIILEAINLSPPIGSKLRKIYNAVKTEQYNKGVSKEIGWRIENPTLSAVANVVEALFNIPIARIVNKANNVEEAVTGNHQMWQRVALALGWSRWSIGVKDEELEQAKSDAKETRKEDKKKEKQLEKEQRKKEGYKTIRCSGRNSSGKRCGLTTETKAKTWKCFHHSAFKDGMDRDGDGLKEYRCTGKTSSGKRCKNKTENKNKRCYAHQ
tara:strand:- start:6558 stop:14585 length:8028 start_codon:yes stop_codon:yes gene_type:complete